MPTSRLLTAFLLSIAILFSNRLSAQTLSAVGSATSSDVSTNGTTIVTVDKSGNLVLTSLTGSTSTTLLSNGVMLPNGLGAEVSFLAFGSPFLQGSSVYFGATTSSGAGYYSVALTGGQVTVIADSTQTDGAGVVVKPVALPVEITTNAYYGVTPLPVLSANLAPLPTGGVIFSTDHGLLLQNASGTRSYVSQYSQLSGCTAISNFATDGNIYAAFALTSTHHLVLLENNAPQLTCSNVQLDLGVIADFATAPSTGILPGQLSAGLLYTGGIAPFTVVDSGYVYFTSVVSLTDTTTNRGYYGGIFRIAPGGSLQKVIAVDDSRLAGYSSSLGTNLALFLNTPFAVHGDALLFETVSTDHYNVPGTFYGQGYFFLDQLKGAIMSIAKQGDQLASKVSFYPYNTGRVLPTSLTTNGKLAIAITVGDTSGSSLQLYKQSFTTDLSTLGVSSGVLPTSSTTLVYSGPASLAGSPATFTATVASAQGPATGTVSLMSGSTVLATSTLGSSGVASLTTSALPAGTSSVTAVYGGSSTVSASTSNAIQVTLAGFSVAADTSALTLKSGNSVTSKLTVNSLGGFGSTVTFACGGLPATVSCKFLPASVTPLAGAAASTTLTLTSPAQTAQNRTAVLALAAGFGCFSFGFFFRKRAAGCIRLALLLLVASLSMMVSGCASTSTSTAIATTANFSVTATSGTFSQTIPLTVVLNP